MPQSRTPRVESPSRMAIVAASTINLRIVARANATTVPVVPNVLWDRANCKQLSGAPHERANLEDSRPVTIACVQDYRGAIIHAELMILNALLQLRNTSVFHAENRTEYLWVGENPTPIEGLAFPIDRFSSIDMPKSCSARPIIKATSGCPL